MKLLHTQGLGDFIYYMKSLEILDVVPTTVYARQNTVIKFINSKYPTTVTKKTSGLLHEVLILIIYQPYISNKIKTKYQKYINFFRNDKKFFYIRNFIRNLECKIPRRHNATRGILHALHYKNFEYKINHCEKNKNSIKKYKKIIIAPGCGSSQKFKRWNLNAYKELIRKILIYHNDINVKILFGPDEDDIKILFQSFDLDIDIVSNISFEELHEIIDGKTILISSDSGIAHFASTTDAALVTLFGPSNPIKTKPITNKGYIITPEVKLNCAPCINRNRAYGCDNNECMNSISVNNVYSRVNQLITNDK